MSPRSEPNLPAMPTHPARAVSVPGQSLGRQEAFATHQDLSHPGNRSVGFCPFSIARPDERPAPPLRQYVHSWLPWRSEPLRRTLRPRSGAIAADGSRGTERAGRWCRVGVERRRGHQSISTCRRSSRRGPARGLGLGGGPCRLSGAGLRGLTVWRPRSSIRPVLPDVPSSGNASTRRTERRGPCPGSSGQHDPNCTVRPVGPG